eukprot:gb/GEZN01010114.1/.p1 GENE.gb/GEZN01010114.1/~~gb/GEZN01010114.1/.p1  ORF type:complete len:171 (-),score=26.60 gb/GEZN01010114.1/:654-1166(-)
MAEAQREVDQPKSEMHLAKRRVAQAKSEVNLAKREVDLAKREVREERQLPEAERTGADEVAKAKIKYYRSAVEAHAVAVQAAQRQLDLSVSGTDPKPAFPLMDRRHVMVFILLFFTLYLWSWLLHFIDDSSYPTVEVFLDWIRNRLLKAFFVWASLSFVAELTSYLPNPV